jgi:hypothetical protein
MALFLVFSLKINEFNEKRLLSKVNLPSRFFTWLDSSDFNPLEIIENREKLTFQKKSFQGQIIKEDSYIEEDRFDVESDVVLTSLDKIDFNERSSLEEIKKGEFRDNRFGDRKVYRLMITSPDVINLSERINIIMKKFKAVKGGSVKAGAQLPGGLYYNLLIPTKNLKNFFSEIDANENINIYLSKSRMYAPKGQSNVFIWVKKI